MHFQCLTLKPSSMRRRPVPPPLFRIYPAKTLGWFESLCTQMTQTIENSSRYSSSLPNLTVPATESPPEFQSGVRQAEHTNRQNVRFGQPTVGTYVLIEQWRKEYNQVRPHSALGYRPPAPEKGAGPTARILVQKVDQLLGADYEPRGFQEAKRR